MVEPKATGVTFTTATFLGVLADAGDLFVLLVRELAEGHNLVILLVIDLSAGDLIKKALAGEEEVLAVFAAVVFFQLVRFG